MSNSSAAPLSSSLSSSAMNFFIVTLCLIVGIVAVTHQSAQAMSLAEQIEQQSSAAGKSSATLAVIENPDLVARVLDNLLRSVLYSANVDLQSMSQTGMAVKRGLDLGISRGFSGSQAGKHLMGLSAASFANGPGRR